MSAKEVRAARVFFLVTTHCDGRQMGNSLKIDMPKKKQKQDFFYLQKCFRLFLFVFCCWFFVVGFFLVVFLFDFCFTAYCA